jgi:hypothetical protein
VRERGGGGVADLVLHGDGGGDACGQSRLRHAQQRAPA